MKCDNEQGMFQAIMLSPADFDANSWSMACSAELTKVYNSEHQLTLILMNENHIRPNQTNSQRQSVKIQIPRQFVPSAQISCTDAYEFSNRSNRSFEI